ncbi:hypothetical protein [Prauserella shujinwangii]|nr:hypothetical protein [Prauserella shujinwangii]
MSRRSHQRGASRPARGTLLAVSSATLAVAAHALADGTMPHLALTLTLAIVIGWVAAALADIARGVQGRLLVLGGAQLTTHWVLAGLTAHDGGVGHGLAMPVTHGVATMLTALVLVHAESMLAAAVASLYLLLPVSWKPAPIPAGTPVRAVVRPTGGPYFVEVLLRRVNGRRGPPLLS